PVRYEAARDDVLPHLEHSWQPVHPQEIDDSSEVELVERIGGDNHSVGTFAHRRGERAVELVDVAYPHGNQRYRDRRRRRLQFDKVVHVGNIFWIPKQRHTREGRHGFLEDLQAFGDDLRTEDGIPCDISTRSGKARYETCLHWIAGPHHDDGDPGR